MSDTSGITLLPKLMIAGGGTGGHVLAGISVAEEWQKQFKLNREMNRICFIGAQGRMEEQLVPQAGYPLKLLRVGSLNRVSFQRKLTTLFQLPLAFLHSAYFLFREKPSVLLGVGGYSSGPVLLMARVMNALGLLKTKIAMLEQNSVPGFTNRLVSRFADIIFAAFPGTEKQFAGKKVIVTGNPIRMVMQPMPSAKRIPFTIFIFGGSQGAVGINTLVIEALAHLKPLKDQLKWIHQTGVKDFERVQKAYFEAGIVGRIEKFIDDMASVYQESSLIICRAGSSTLSEIAAVGRASILIPLPTAADNHQEHNARVLSEAGAAHLFIQTGAQGEDLAPV